jgi:CrcB protein
MIKSILLVGLGGGLGSIFRYLTAVLVNKHFSFIYPLATLMTNVIGCFLIGLLLGWFEKQHWTGPELKFLLVIGFCGGYTTFSTFAFENISLLQANHTLVAFAYIAMSVIAGLLATWLGLFVVR